MKSTAMFVATALLALTACSSKPADKEPAPLNESAAATNATSPENVVVATPVTGANGEPVISEKQAKSEPVQIAAPEVSEAQIRDDAAASGMTSRLPDPAEPAQAPVAEDKK